MGRHSAPDDEPDDAAVVASVALDLGPAQPDLPRGRHARPGEPGGRPAAEDDHRTQMIAIVDPGVEVDDIQVDTHDTDVIVPPPDFLPLGDAPAEPSKAERKAAKAAAKSAAGAAKAEARAASKTEKETKAGPDPGATAPTAPNAPTTPARPTGPKAKRKRDGETDTQADLRVLRENSAVRARSIAAVLVSFLLYTVVMIVIARTDVYLLWIWIPIVVAGVLVGVVLDLAHRSPKGSEPAPPLEPMG
jgi:hypothetical protein